MNIKVMLVDDHLIFREGLRSLIAKEADMTIVAEAGDGEAAFSQAKEKLPDVVVMDVSMPVMNGIDATIKIASELSSCRVLVLSMESDRWFVVEALRAGATGYMLKDCAYQELASAIRTVAAGEIYLGPKISSLIIRSYLLHEPDDESLAFGRLTEREREVLKLIADGKSTKEIAFTFDVCLKTVDSQRHNIMKKLGLYSIAELTKFAVRQGISPLD